MAGGWGPVAANKTLLLILTAAAWANMADNAAASPNTAVEYSLHTASPSGGNQTTSEAAFTSYARKALNRNATDHTVSTNTVAVAALMSWPAATGGSETETHFGVGKSHTGTGELWLWGTLTPNIAVASGVTPQLTTAAWGTLAV